MRDTLEEFFGQFKETEDTKVEINDGDDVAEDEDFDDSIFDKEENNNTFNDWDARFYNDNGEYGVVDHKN